MTTDDPTTRLRATLDRVRHYSARVTLPKGTATVAADDLRTALDALAAQTERADAAEARVVALRRAADDRGVRLADVAGIAADAMAAGLAECDRLRERMAYLAPRERPGQAVANAMHWIDATFYESARGTDIDPWEDHTRIGAYLGAWAESVRADRDAAVAQREALAGAVRAYEAADARWRSVRFMIAEHIDQEAVDLEARLHRERDAARAALDAALAAAGGAS
jgi:hypothetical protein